MQNLLKASVLFWISLAVIGFTEPARAAEEQPVFHVPPQKIASYIAAKKGRKRALIVWASWCPYCRQKMPGLAKIEKQKPGSLTLVSVDEDFQDLRNYLNRTGALPFRIIVVKHTPGQSLNKSLATLKIAPVKGYPTAIYLDENNKVVQQGGLDIQHLRNFIFGTETKPPNGSEVK